MIDYRAHFAALRRIGYDGPISLEPHLDGSSATIRKCQEAFERLWQEG
jgi:sugar phosphate isomerase/epimerase